MKKHLAQPLVDVMHVQGSPLTSGVLRLRARTQLSKMPSPALRSVSRAAVLFTERFSRHLYFSPRAQHTNRTVGFCLRSRE